LVYDGFAFAQPIYVLLRAAAFMKKGKITKFTLDPDNPPKTDWRAFDAMSEEERHQAALSDPDCPPLTEEQLARARSRAAARAYKN